MTTLAELGHQLRALRAASGRTVASVAADAGLSVPYIANLENGRGNPTMAALGRRSRCAGLGADADPGRDHQARAERAAVAGPVCSHRPVPAGELRVGGHPRPPA